MLHLEMWMYVHGIAATIATSYLEWDEAFISRVLTDGYEGMKSRYAGESFSGASGTAHQERDGK